MAATADGSGSLSGRYRLGRVIGRGGMALVFEARDELLGRDVAIKVFRGAGDGGEDEIRRQRLEVKMLASLSHHSLTTLLDAGVDVGEDGSPRIFLVMELVRGPDLKQRLAEGPLTAVEIAQIAYDLAEALEYMHSEGVVHRDVKPANILLVEPGTGRRARARLTDFGIADLQGREPNDTEATTGTAAYLSPEQARRRPVDSASDVYSLGLVILECFTGSVAFPGDVLQSALARLGSDPEVPASVPEDWRPLLAAMTARRPADRPTMSQLVLAFRQLAESGRRREGEQPGDEGTLSGGAAVVGSSTDVTFGRLTSLASRMLRVPIAMVTMAGVDRVWGITPPELPEFDPVELLADSSQVIPDAWLDPRAERNPLLAAGLGRFYAGVPLLAGDGRSWGTLSVLDAAPRKLSAEDLAVLEDLAAMAMSELGARVVVAQLTGADAPTGSRVSSPRE
ncbi:MAG: serine/threonine protein kinase [Naasia sp.]|nr:serine/threonine protein kinase [Naasia sp.]